MIDFAPIGWERMEASWWPAVANRIERPWPREAVMMDLRWWRGQEFVRGKKLLPGRPALQQRWGWKDWDVRVILRAEKEWEDPLKASPAPDSTSVPPVFTSSTPESTSGGKVETAESGEILQNSPAPLQFSPQILHTRDSLSTDTQFTGTPQRETPPTPSQPPPVSVEPVEAPPPQPSPKSQPSHKASSAFSHPTPVEKPASTEATDLVSALDGLADGPALARKLVEAGISDLAALASQDPDALRFVEGIGQHRAKKIRDALEKKGIFLTGKPAERGPPRPTAGSPAPKPDKLAATASGLNRFLERHAGTKPHELRE